MKKLHMMILGSLVIAAGMLLFAACKPGESNDIPGGSIETPGDGAGGGEGATSPGHPLSVVEAPKLHTLSIIGIRWTPPASGGKNATGDVIDPGTLTYDVQYKKKDSSGDWVSAPDGSNIAGNPDGDDRIFSITGLSEDTEYTVQVRARNGSETFHASGWTTSEKTISTRDKDPSEPRNVRTGGRGSVRTDRIRIKWGKPFWGGVDASGTVIGPDTLDYDVQYKEASAVTGWTDVNTLTDTILSTGTGADCNVTVTNLSPGTEYKFQVRAKTGSSSSENKFSDWVESPVISTASE